jgi:AcrR family transcriptional regulator
MADDKIDRRVQRTRDLLRRALMQLIDEKGYDTLTIQDITERANLGRTTFYLHYESKDDLLLDHHAEFEIEIPLAIWSQKDLPEDEAISGLVQYLKQFANDRGIYMAIVRGKDGDIIMRGIQEQMVLNLQASLKEAFPEQEPTMPMDILCNYIAGAQISLIDWWMMNKTGRDALTLARTIQRLQHAAIRDAYNIG